MAMSFLGNGTSGGSTPFQRIMEPSTLGMYIQLEQAELMRVKRYAEHWRFYVGQHWNFAREDGEPLVTVNFTRAVVDKCVSWLVGKGMTIKVPDPLRNLTLPVLEEVWKYNLVDQLLFNIATMGGVTGDAFVLVTYSEPTAQARRINPHTKGQIRIQLLNSEQVYPQWDPLNVNVLLSVRIETIYYDNRQQKSDNPDAQGRQLHTRRHTQVITPEQIIETYQGETPVARPNPLGEISLVHIKNHSLPGEYYGMSDLEGIVDLNREYNEKATDVSDIVNYHSAPVTVVQGAKVRDLARSARNIWSGLPVDAKVYNLNLDTDLTAALSYMSTIKQSLLELASVPEGSLGSVQPISNTSGVALHTQYQPLVEKTDRKKTLYQPALVDINYYILRIMETVDPSFRLRTDLCKSCGGRIVEFTNDNGYVVKECYLVDEQTFEFQKPDDVKIRWMRQFSFGQKLTEITYAQIKKEAGKIGTSYWDPELVQTADEKAALDHAEALKQQPPPEPQFGPEGNALPAPKKAEAPVGRPVQIPTESIELPEEPEEITLQQYEMAADGTRTLKGTSTIQVVPSGCKKHEYLNPYESECLLNDTVPKDKQLQMEYFSVLLDKEIVSRRWVRKQIAELDDDPEQMEKDIEDERAAREPAPVEPGGDEGQTPDELGRTQGPPFGSNLPGG